MGGSGPSSTPYSLARLYTPYSLARLYSCPGRLGEAGQEGAQACRVAGWPGLGMDSPQDMVPQGRRSRCPALRRLVPVGFGAEARTLFVLSGPLFLFQMLNFMVYVVSTVFCGHLGTVELAAVTLSVAFVNVCGVSIGFGLSSACDTLMSQSFGSPNKKHVGVILQRGMLVLLLCCLPCWALFLNTQLILLLCRQDPAVSRLAQEYVQVYIPGLPANFLYSLQAKYLQNQGIVWPQVFSGIVGNCVNGLANYILVSVLGQGVRGSAFANTISQFSQAVFLLFYIVLKKLHLETWAGLLSVLDLSAQAVIYEVATVVYMIPMGLSIAVCVRVGTALGAADTVQAKRSAISGTLCTVGTSLVVGILLSLLRNKLGHIFTNDEEVVALVNKVLPLYIFFQLFEALCCLYAGVLRGTGRQAFGAVVNAVMYYAIGLPLGVVLTFLVGMGIMGLWLGMLVCVMLATAAFVTYTARMDWKRAAEEAQKHAGLPPLGSTDSMALGPRPGPEKAVVSSVATGSSPGVILTTYSRSGGHPDLLRTPEAVHALPTPAGRLSAKQLALHRGAALGVAVGSLIVGLILRVLTTTA
ncbi:multidrug and toxin extrusion protein 2 isoform X3 [Bubalus bubalis]|uniref:multidrug and toxin extrusion protein 2 isoform X3 n=1 Tax=Bubalus bubalis TaxID=89462 RepID=UPI001E1B959B|nr:multidrug and toxin extrusion protein 2 isoform X3 [Bubalus bubalis]